MVYVRNADTIALTTRDTPTSIRIVAQNANQVVLVVNSLRNVLTRMFVPNQKTRFPAVSAFLVSGEPATKRMTRRTIWNKPQTRLNWVTAD